MEAAVTNTKGVFEALGGFARKRVSGERCELCGTSVAGEHPHLLEAANGQILCSCDPCAALFSHRGDGRKLLRIPRDARNLPSFELSEARWGTLRIPIDLAFFVHNFAADRIMAYYPGPAGCTESHLSLEAWQEIELANPALRTMERGVEALLVDRTRGNRRQFIVPIDQCYRLAGSIRMNWRGFSGGEAVWDKVDEFFRAIGDRAHA